MTGLDFSAAREMPEKDMVKKYCENGMPAVLAEGTLEAAKISRYSFKPVGERYSTKFFCRGAGSIAVSVLFIGIMFSGLALTSAAQDRPQLKRPQQGSEEKPVETKKPKKVKGPRAIGILQISDGKATLIPVAILVDGKFYDATAYKAEPVPMALESGTVYEAEQAGESQGLFTANGAMHSKGVNSVHPWWGTGSYLPKGTEATKTSHKAEDVPVGLDSSGDEPPRLTRKASAPSSNPDAHSEDTSASPAPSGKQGSTSEGKSSADASRANTKASAGTSSDDNKEGNTDKKQTATGQTGSADGPPGESDQAHEAENYYRPTLRRGKPTLAAPEEKDAVPKVAAPEVVTTSSAASGAKVVKVMAAVSDSSGPDPQSYQYFWKEGEEEERRKQMLSLAADELRAYVSARAKGAIAAARDSGKPMRTQRKATAKLVQPEFENVRFAGFDVWKNNQPVMILSADARLPGETGAGSSGETYSITLVSRTDIYGSLRKLYAGLTDKFHLDVTPRLELIDVVDADGDGRGELLFHETTDGGSGYVIYRATGDKLWKMFSSTSAE
jgi:hypothetical protein